jgi:hypothetical protein
VHVHSGEQAVVGIVEAPGGGVQPKSEDQPNGKRQPPHFVHASQPSLRSDDAERDAMPVASDAERPLPNTRRNVAWRSEG